MTPLTTARPLVLLAGLAILVAACGGGTPTAAPATAAPATAAPATVAPPTQGPVATDGGAPTFVMPSFALPSGDTELEDLLPDEIAGQAVQKFSMTGDAFMGIGDGGSEEIQAVLDQFNKEPSDLSVAFASTEAIVVLAYRIKGVPASQFFNAFLTASGDDGEVTVTDENYGGKAVKKIVSSSTDLGTAYVYSSGDVMYMVGGEDVSDDLLNEAFSKIG